MEIFSKKLTSTDVSKRLTVKTKSLTHFSPFQVGQNLELLQVEDEGGIKWRFKLHVRRKGKYRKPVLGGGWTRFMKSKNLRAGDQVQFFKEGSGYKIQVQKPVKFFNRVIGYATSHLAAVDV